MLDRGATCIVYLLLPCYRFRVGCMVGTITCRRSCFHSLHWYAAGSDVSYFHEPRRKNITALDIDRWCALRINLPSSLKPGIHRINWLDSRVWAGWFCVVTIHNRGHCLKVWNRGPATIVSGKLFPRFRLRQNSRLFAMTAFMAFIWAIVPNHARNS